MLATQGVVVVAVFVVVVHTKVKYVYAQWKQEKITYLHKRQHIRINNQSSVQVHKYFCKNYAFLCTQPSWQTRKYVCHMCVCKKFQLCMRTNIYMIMPNTIGSYSLVCATEAAACAVQMYVG